MNKEYIKNLREFSQNLKILYVEDNQEARDSTMELLTMFFKNIIIAVDGEDGLDKFKDENNKDIQLIITDINMPKLNGLDMISKIKEHNEDISILVISAYSEIEYLMESIKIQVDDYLLKPIQTTTFVSVISKILKKIKLENENKEYKNNLEQLVQKQVDEIEKQNKIIYQQSKLAAMGEIIDSIAHQWKQPISTISILTQSLQIQCNLDNDFNIENIKKCSKSVDLQIKHLLSTIDEFRNFFRPDINTQTVHIKEIIDSTLILLKDELIKHDISIDITGDTDIIINIIPNEFKHILINIINNAKDAFQKIIKDKLININIKQDNKSVQLTISDNAGGIPIDIIEHIFEPNFTTKELGKGTGIGLYMSKMIIEKINGTLIVNNNSNGAVFTIRIPLSK